MQHDEPRLSNLTLPAQYFSDRGKDNELLSIDHLFVVEILLIIVLLLITIVKRLRRINNVTTAAAIDVSDAATTTTHSAVTAPQ